MTIPEPIPVPHGRAEPLGPGLRRIIAPNPSPMTYWGTNTYVLGTEEVVVIDPGPDLDAHLAAILDTIGAARVSHILVTHAHVDHSPLAPRLRAETGAAVHAYGPATTGRSAVMQRLAESGVTGGGEGVDSGFTPDHALADGEVLATGAGPITALWTPGHIGNHLSFDWMGEVFTGDHVMGWASSMVSPPDGDLTQFMTSCERLKVHGAVRFHPGHGAPVETPMERLDWLIAHRQSRSAQILDALAEAPATIRDLTARVYSDVDPRLLPAAERNVLAHLVDLYEKFEVSAAPRLSATAIFARI